MNHAWINDCDELNSFVAAAESHSWWRQCHDERDFTKCTRGNPQSVCRMGAAAKPSGNRGAAMAQTTHMMHLFVGISKRFTRALD
jgi:hypothetical protein